MKINKLIEIQDEVEIDISVEEILAAIAEATDSMGSTLQGISNCMKFLTAIPDPIITEMTPEHKKRIRNFLIIQAARFNL
jgi:hypothetical protein